MVPEALPSRTDSGAGRRLDRDRLRSRHFDSGSDRVRKDAGGVLGGDRPLLPGGGVRRGPPRDRRRVRLAVAGPHRRREREPPQAPPRDRRSRQRSRPRASTRAGGGAQRRHAFLGALGYVAQPPRDRRDDARVVLPPAHLGARPGDVGNREDGHRRRDSRARPGQTRLAPRFKPGAARPPRGPVGSRGKRRLAPAGLTPGADRAVGDTATYIDHRPAARRSRARADPGERRAEVHHRRRRAPAATRRRYRAARRRARSGLDP